jgi:hypothetical protein
MPRPARRLYRGPRHECAAQVCPLPDGISIEEGAAMMLKG